VTDFTDTSVFNSLELGAAMAQLNFPSVPTQMHAFHPVSTPPTASLTPHSNVESMTASFLHALARTQQPPQAPIDHDEHDFDDDDDYHSYDPLGINSLEVVSPINDRSSSSGSVVGTPSAQQHTRAQTNMSEEELRIARLARKAEAARQVCCLCRFDCILNCFELRFFVCVLLSHVNVAKQPTVIACSDYKN
jgi:hypothetical protein